MKIILAFLILLSQGGLWAQVGPQPAPRTGKLHLDPSHPTATWPGLGEANVFSPNYTATITVEVDKDGDVIPPGGTAAIRYTLRAAPQVVTDCEDKDTIWTPTKGGNGEYQVTNTARIKAKAELKVTCEWGPVPGGFAGGPGSAPPPIPGLGTASVDMIRTTVKWSSMNPPVALGIHTYLGEMADGHSSIALRADFFDANGWPITVTLKDGQAHMIVGVGATATCHPSVGDKVQSAWVEVWSASPSYVAGRIFFDDGRNRWEEAPITMIFVDFELKATASLYSLVFPWQGTCWLSNETGGYSDSVNVSGPKFDWSIDLGAGFFSIGTSTENRFNITLESKGLSGALNDCAVRAASWRFFNLHQSFFFNTEYFIDATLVGKAETFEVIDPRTHYRTERIARFQQQVITVRERASSPENYRASAGGYLAEIDRMMLEVRDYLWTAPANAQEPLVPA